MHKYRLISKKGEGTFSEVLKAQSVKNGQYVAIKCMKNHFQSIEQVNNLREIQALKRLNPHQNIVRLQEVLFDKATGRLALVFELMDMNIYELIRGRKTYLSERRIKLYMFQLMKAMDHMHRNGIFHRDIKPENILIVDDKLKVADYGSCRGIFSKPPYTEYISTRWYRAPECLLTDGWYDYKMDIWGIGCVFFEIVSLFPLFPGTNELDQIERIHNIIGTPEADLLAKFKKYSSHLKFDFETKDGTGIAALIPHASRDCIDLIEALLTYNPEKRLTARQALLHPYFRDIVEAERRIRQPPKLPTHIGHLVSPSGTDSSRHSVGKSKHRRKHNDKIKKLPSIRNRNAQAKTTRSNAKAPANDLEQLPVIMSKKIGSSKPPVSKNYFSTRHKKGRTKKQQKYHYGNAAVWNQQ